MAENSSIEWTDHTFNLWRGCAHAMLVDGSRHPGCDHCYAEKLSGRNPAVLGTWGEVGTRVLAAPEYRHLPYKWHEAAVAAGERQRVFALSIGDVFEEWTGPILHAGKQPVFVSKDLRASRAPSDRATMDDLRRELFATIDATPNLDWQLLTKRPQNIRRMWPCPLDTDGDGNCHVCSRGVSHRRENVWLITSVSDQATTDAMVPELLQCRDLSPVLGLSMEPLLGPVDLRRIKIPGESYELDALKGHLRGTITRDIRKCARLNWVIIGCESNGPKVGRLSIDGKASKADWIGWAIAIVEQCRAAGVAVFVKQIPLAGRVCHDINLFPAALRFREFPDRVLAG